MLLPVSATKRLLPLSTVTARGDLGFHPASGKYLHQGETYQIDAEVFTAELFDLAPEQPDQPAPDLLVTDPAPDSEPQQ